MDLYDYIIVGAGSAGCVMANRLSASPKMRILLIEAGPSDSHPYVAMPKGIAKLRLHPTLTWRFEVEPELGQNSGEIWPRGKLIGGTSSINGMFYVRGQPQDYDDWEKLGNPGWGWNDMAPVFKAMENHELGADQMRGVGGPLHISLPYKDNPMHNAIFKAAEEMGIPRRDDFNRPDQLGAGYIPLTTYKGRRWSAARAFLDPARRRPNLTIWKTTLVQRIAFDGRRAQGVICRLDDGQIKKVFAGREVIVSAGTIKSAHLLQLSGVGPAKHLKDNGVPIVHDSPGVGANMREHLRMTVIHRLIGTHGHNREYRGLRLLKNVGQYYLFRNGLMSQSTSGIAGFARSGVEGQRPDIQFSVVPMSWETNPYKAGGNVRTDPLPGISCWAYFLHPESRGSVTLRSPNPDDIPTIRPNWLSTDHDRRSAKAVFRFLRNLMSRPALGNYLGEETKPGREISTDGDVASIYGRFGATGNHAVGTCKMGSDAEAVVDSRLRVHGVENLRVVDCSVFPQMVSGNTNAPVMATAWRLADLMEEEELQAKSKPIRVVA